MDFPLRIELAEKTLHVVARVSRPEPDVRGGNMWACVFGWENASFGERSVYGASALQALALAIPLLEISLRSEFPGARITMAGRLFVTPEHQAEP